MAATPKKPPEPRIEVHKPVLLSGVPMATLIPALSEVSGGDVQSIVYYQLHFLSRDDWQWQSERDAEYQNFLKDYCIEETKESHAAYMKWLNDVLMAQAEEVYAVAGVRPEDMNPNEWEFLEEDQVLEDDLQDETDEGGSSEGELEEGSEEDLYTEDVSSYNQPLDFYEEGESIGYNPCRSKRICFTRLHRQLSFVTKRRIISAVSDLENRDFISVKRTGRVNTYSPNYQVADFVSRIIARKNLSEAYGSGLIVLPALAEIIGLKAAIVLQQIHLRLYKGGPDYYFCRSLADWHSKTFPFWGEETVKRAFRKLKTLDLIHSKPYPRDDGGYVNSYRINYAHVAELMGMPPPVFAYGQPSSIGSNTASTPWGNEKWKNPASQFDDYDKNIEELLSSP